MNLPAKAIMRFSNAVSTLGAEVQAVRVGFRVLLNDESSETAVFEGSVLRRQPNQWLDREVDLSRWSRSRVRLTLETRARAGAGDVFHDAYLHAFLKTGSPGEAARFANVAAARKCEGMSGRAPLPPEQELWDAIQY